MLNTLSAYKSFQYFNRDLLHLLYLIVSIKWQVEWPAKVRSSRGSLLEFEVDLVGVGLCKDGSLVRAVFFTNSDIFSSKKAIVDIMSEMRCS